VRPTAARPVAEARYSDLSLEKLQSLTDATDHDGIMSAVLHGTNHSKDHKNRGMLQAIRQAPIVFRAPNTPGTEGTLKQNTLPAHPERRVADWPLPLGSAPLFSCDSLVC